MTAPEETFVKVPTFVHAAVGTGELSPTGLALYVVLRSYRNHRRQVAWPSMATLAKAMRMKNPRNLIKYIGELESIGAVQISKDPGTSNTYIFPETSTSGSSTSGDTTPAENADWGTTSTSGGTTPVPQEVPPRTSGGTTTRTSGGTQTRQSEPDRLTTSREHLVDTTAAGENADAAELAGPVLAPLEGPPPPKVLTKPRMADPIEAVLPWIEGELGGYLTNEAQSMVEGKVASCVPPLVIKAKLLDLMLVRQAS